MPPKRKVTDEEKTQQTRIAIVKEDRCNPSKCNLDCRLGCPVNGMGKLCIEVTHKAKRATISEILCIGCGICPRRCPFHAINIINIPTSLSKDVTHRYGPNAFKLHRLPLPRPGVVLGLVGINGIGKSTALHILRGHLKPNFGEFLDPPEWPEIIKHFQGSSLFNYFTAMLENKIVPIEKAQYVDSIAKIVKHRVGKVLEVKNANGMMKEVIEELGLEPLLTRAVPQLSGGELQRFALALTMMANANCYLIDEPTSYLDVKQRLIVGALIRRMIETRWGHFEEDGLKDVSAGMPGKYCIVVEHDLAILDYVSDQVSLLYGFPGAYGVVTAPYSVRDGINIFLDGYIPTENMRFREEPVVFRISDVEDEPDKTGPEDKAKHSGKGSKGSTEAETKKGKEAGRSNGGSGKTEQKEDEAPKKPAGKTERGQENEGKIIPWPAMTGVRGDFKLHIEPGAFVRNEIVVLVGQNGCGKTTFIRMLAGLVRPVEEDVSVPDVTISYKPQTIAPKWESTVADLLQTKLKGAHRHPMFQSDVMKPLNMEPLMDRMVQNLSGGELQRTAIVLALGKPLSNVYLLDEPSAYLDSEQRIVTAKVIKRFVMHRPCTAMIVEHDFLMSIYMGDRVVVYDGTPGVECTAKTPKPLVAGMNDFLRSVGVTFRRDSSNLRPRINRLGSVKDREQKASGMFFATQFVDDDEKK